MTAVQAGLLAQLAATGGAVACAWAPLRLRAALAGAAGIILSLAAAATACLVLSGHRGTVTVPTALGTGSVSLAPGPLGAGFLLLAAAVSALACLYAVTGAHGASLSRPALAAMPVFLLGMFGVAQAADAVSFLLAWELMALASTALVLTEHRRRPEVATAGLWYGAMTHVSFVLLLAGFAVLADAAGSVSFSAMARLDSHSAAASAGFLLVALGGATKAGLVPLHVWLPRAHPEAPSHVSAIMSAAMVKLGLYAALLVAVQLLPHGPAWWGMVLLVMGGVSAAYGILQASVAVDLKRLLAYSTTENLGLMFLALGAALLLDAYGATAPAAVALAACLLLAASHATFKVTLFLAAGSVLHGTGRRDLDTLGGLAARMPWTGAAFAVAALGAAALPVSGGFAAEWVLLQALIHGARPADDVVAVAMAGCVAVVALTAGLALLTFVKAYGIAFLARPRSAGAESAHEAGAGERAAMALGALGVLAVGLAPGPVAVVLARTVGLDTVTSTLWGGIELPGVSAALQPLALAAGAIVLALPVIAVSAASARRRPRRRTELAWGCGGERSSARMQYTATSYAEPLTRVFDDALRPVREVEVSEETGPHPVLKRMVVAQRVSDRIEDGAYQPLLRVMTRFGVAARAVQNGSIRRYLAFSFAALVAVLIWVAAR